MPIRFFNIRSGEEVVAENEPQIAALWGSSDRSPNANQGQDMGWRFAPEVVVEMKAIMADPTKIQEIANRFRIMYEDVSESDVLTWISNRTDLMTAPVATQDDYADDYQAQIKQLEKQNQDELDARIPSTVETTTESLADMERRAALAERIAKAEAKTTVSDSTSAPSKK